MLHIVLVEPEIPQNTGNIARTCAATASKLHLVKPLGFDIPDKYLKRAGLDYWPMVQLEIHENMESFFRKYADEEFYYVTTKAKKSYVQINYPQEVFLVFGKESRGLPENLLSRVMESCVRIPMKTEARSLNLSNSVAILTYEYYRQHNFAGLQEWGCLTGRDEIEGSWIDYV